MWLQLASFHDSTFENKFTFYVTQMIEKKLVLLLPILFNNKKTGLAWPRSQTYQTYAASQAPFRVQGSGMIPGALQRETAKQAVCCGISPGHAGSGCENGIRQADWLDSADLPAG